MFYFTYIIQSIQHNDLYVGYTADLKERLKRHNSGLNISTKSHRPWRIVHYEAYRNDEDAKRREKYLKTSQGSRLLKRMLKEYFTRRNMNKYTFRKTILTLLSLLFLCVPTLSFSAGLFFETETIEFTQGDEFLASIFLNTEGESINAVEGKISFPPQLLEIREVRDGNSVVNFWVERPKMGQPTNISFSGIIPGGYQRPKGFLFSVVFRAKESGKGTIEINDARILLNDSDGTKATLKISPLKFSISPSGPLNKRRAISIVDTRPPEDFHADIARDPALFSGQWFIVFATQDKVSGMDHYEVCEGTKSLCTIAESPYLLGNQKLDKKIFVKAVDKSGNEKVEVVYPANWNPWYRNNWIVGILILSVLIIPIIKRKFYDKNF